MIVCTDEIEKLKKLEKNERGIYGKLYIVFLMQSYGSCLCVCVRVCVRACVHVCVCVSLVL